MWLVLYSSPWFGKAPTWNCINAHPFRNIFRKEPRRQVSKCDCQVVPSISRIKIKSRANSLTSEPDHKGKPNPILPRREYRIAELHLPHIFCLYKLIVIRHGKSRSDMERDVRLDLCRSHLTEEDGRWELQGSGSPEWDDPHGTGKSRSFRRRSGDPEAWLGKYPNWNCRRGFSSRMRFRPMGSAILPGLTNRGRGHKGMILDFGVALTRAVRWNARFRYRSCGNIARNTRASKVLFEVSRWFNKMCILPKRHYTRRTHIFVQCKLNFRSQKFDLKKTNTLTKFI